MNFLQVDGKRFLVFGVANKKSVAWHIAKILEECGAIVVYVVHTESRKESLAKTLAGREILVCDVEHEDQIDAVASQLREQGQKFHGLVHSIAFADYETGPKPFHETSKAQFLRAVDISCYSLMAIALSRATFNSSSLAEMPAGRTGSVSTGSQR